MKTLRFFLVVAALAVTACSVDYSPSCHSVNSLSVPSNVRQVEIARQAWVVLSDRRRQEEWPAAMERYNRALLTVVERMRCDWKRGKGDVRDIPGAPYALVRPDFIDGKWTSLYEDVIPCSSIDTSVHLKERVFVEGLGIPLAGVVKSDTDMVKNQVIKDNGNVHTITAVLDFDHRINGSPTLKIIPRLKKATIRTGHTIQPLAADFTAPIYIFWGRSQVDRSAFLGLFNPRRAMDYRGLYFSEPYDPEKIPVLFIHGLMSSPVTFSNMVNRLQADPVIRRHYQFWYFSYPSGMPWIVPAKDLRDALNAVFAEYDPRGKSPTLNKMVFAGHSMGGLITRLNNSTKPWTLIPYFIKDCDEIKHYDYKAASEINLLDNRTSRSTAELLVFQPSPRVSRIVFMATPHRGSDFADRWFGTLAQKLIRMPEAILREITRIGTLSSEMLLFNPERIVEEFTSIGQLSPASPAIKGVQHVYPPAHVSVHSIIGDRGLGNTPRSSDGVVDYRSSHVDFAISETIVPTGHSVQASIPAAAEMRRILREHLQAEGIDTKIPDNEQRAPTIWQENPVQYYFQMFY